MKWKTLLMWLAVPGCGIAGAVVVLRAHDLQGGGTASSDDLGETYVKRVQPLLKKYCFECHSKKAHKGDLNLELFESMTAIRKDLKPWQHLIEQVEVGEMPPKGKSQPSADERKVILAWARAVLDAERARGPATRGAFRSAV